MKTLLLTAFMAITSLAVTVNADKVTTKESSDKYGPGGTCETTSEDSVIIHKICRDKCGRIREAFYGFGQSPRSYWPRTGLGKDEPPTSEYRDEYGEPTVEVVHGPKGDVYRDLRKGGHPHMNPKDGQALVDKLEKTPCAFPCPGPGSMKAGPNPRALPQPTPSTTDKVTDVLKTIGSSVSIDIGGGHTSGHDEHHHGEERHRTAENVSTDKTKTHTTSPITTHKTVTSACKCHPCTCSPCTCH